MRFADKWKDYELLDASCGERLERWGSTILIRPDPQVIWKTPRLHPMWEKADARYVRSNTGGGSWDVRRKLPNEWTVNYQNLSFIIEPMGFKHTGLFPEQAVNWDLFSDLIRSAGREIRVLNLFAYTGGVTLACLEAGAFVCHVDASKGMTQWARDNAAKSGLSDIPQRWIVDDCMKFVAREQRRGSRYDAIIMDPPNYGRGPGGEVWNLEDKIYELVKECVPLLSDSPLFFCINSYTTGLRASAMNYVMASLLKERFPNAAVEDDEIGLPVTSSGLILPCGAACIATF